MSIFYIDFESTATDRFDIEKFLSFEKNVHDPVTSFLLQNIHVLPVRGVKEITYQVNRPDLISWEIYGDTQFWWLVLEYNKILKFTDIKPGLIINYFSIDELEQIYYILKAVETRKQLNLNTLTVQTTINTENIISGGDQKEYLISGLSEVTINHTLNKRPIPIFMTYDESNNEINEDITWRYTAGLEKSQIYINFGSIKTGLLTLN